MKIYKAPPGGKSKDLEPDEMDQDSKLHRNADQDDFTSFDEGDAMTFSQKWKVMKRLLKPRLSPPGYFG